MNKDQSYLQQNLTKNWRDESFDLVDVIAIPKTGDATVRARSLAEVLKDFESNDPTQTYSFVVQLKRKALHAGDVAKQDLYPNTTLEHVYRQDGTLNVDFLVKNANLLIDSGEFALARNIFLTILKSGSSIAVAHYGIGRTYASESKYRDAKIHLRESIAFHPTLEAYMLLAQVEMREGNEQAGAESLERALHLKGLTDTQRFEIHKEVGNCYTRVQSVENAEKHFHKALAIIPSADEIQSNLGSLYLQAARIDAAAQAFQNAISSNSQNDKALCGLGCCQIVQGKKHEAHSNFVKALEINIKNPTAIYYLVKVAYEIKNYQTAARILTQYIEVAPINPALLYSLAGLYFHLGKRQDAKRMCEQILQIRSDHKGARELIELVRKTER